MERTFSAHSGSITLSIKQETLPDFHFSEASSIKVDHPVNVDASRRQQSSACFQEENATATDYLLRFEARQRNPDERKQVDPNAFCALLNENCWSRIPRRGSDAVPARTGFLFLSS